MHFFTRFFTLLPDFESHALRHKKAVQEGLLFSFPQTARRRGTHGIRTRREQAQPAEENSPVDCFRRRGNERSEAIGAAAPERSHALRHEKSTSFEVLFSMISVPVWNGYYIILRRRRNISCGISRISCRAATYHFETRPKHSSSPSRADLFPYNKPPSRHGKNFLNIF